MFYTLEAIGLGLKMRPWIKSLYTFPEVKIRSNGVLSDPFPLKNGTRQDCPLSPILFIISLEPFLRMVRRNRDIDIVIGRVEHKISAYADNLLFSFSNPKISMPNLLKEFQRYGEISNFYINMQKSVDLT